MKHAVKVPALLPVLALAGLSDVVTGCASQGDWPSLARRPIERGVERITGTAEPAPPAPDATATQEAVSDDLVTRLGQLEQAARDAHQRFTARQVAATKIIAAGSGAPIASPAWSSATVALADLTAARSDALVSLGELDRLYAGARIDGQSVDGGNGKAITAVRDQVTAWVADEDAVLADLAGRLDS